MTVLLRRPLFSYRSHTIPLWHFLTAITSLIVLGAFVLFAAYIANEQSQNRLLEIQRDMRNMAQYCRRSHQ